LGGIEGEFSSCKTGQRTVPAANISRGYQAFIPLSSKLDILDIDSMRGHGDVMAQHHFEA
jgi:hypothetical protein